MTSYLKYHFLCVLIITTNTYLSFSQNTWQKCSCNLVMIKDNSLYEGLAIGSPSVIYENGLFKMLYAVGGTDTKGRISLAVSLDGKNWTKYNNGLPVFYPDTNINAWDSHFLDTPDWIKDTINYKMYYFGDNDNDPLGSGIGLAISSDGTNWTRYSFNPVLLPGNSDDWDGLYIESPSIVYDGNLYYLYYSGVDSTYKVRIGVATSTDGITWTKYTGNPILSEGNLLDWDGYSVGTPSVLYKNNKFEMWYSAVSNIDMLDNIIDTIYVGHAYSFDGVNWVKDSLNPILNTYSPPFSILEKRGPWAPSVKYIDSLNSYYMWYETAYGFGLASSNNLLSSINDKNTNTIHFTILPNPNSKKINIQSNIDGKLSVYNNLGQLIYKDVVIKQGDNIYELNIPPQIYVFILETNKARVYKKIIIY